VLSCIHLALLLERAAWFYTQVFC